MSQSEIKTDISAIRRAAASKRWHGHVAAGYRTIRIRDDVLERLARAPGDTWSAKIEKLINRGA